MRVIKDPITNKSIKIHEYIAGDILPMCSSLSFVLITVEVDSTNMFLFDA